MRARYLALLFFIPLAMASPVVLADDSQYAHTGMSSPSDVAFLQISKDEYLDKTLAGILGHVAGVLTGYEFISEEPLPDEWFGLVAGPYSGRSPYVIQPQNNRLIDGVYGRIGSDDDYHIDFFNQHIIDVHGPHVSNADIAAEWVAHQVSDWGGGFIAMENMNRGMMPPLTGSSEYNKWHWVTEAYIENETLGMVLPGMPASTVRLTEKFASVTGDFDSVIWAKLLAAMYSLAYFAEDVRTVVEEASAVLPRNSWPSRIYEMVKQLHETNPDDWRWAQREIRKHKRMVFGCDNIQVIPDVNNAMLLISLLYGDNDYVKTARIAALSGYDADCTAAAALGLMGIIKGMDGTPDEVKEVVYDYGNGVYINDHGFPPHIRLDYPEEQSFDSLARLYQSNAERFIVSAGGRTADGMYLIPAERVPVPASVAIKNYDFEEGNLVNWEVWSDLPSTEHIRALRTSGAHTGDWTGRIDVKDAGVSRLFVRLNSLEPGQTYKATAYLSASNGTDARLFVSGASFDDNYGYSSVTNMQGKHAQRSVTFVAPSDGVCVGLEVVADRTGMGWATMDDLMVEKIAYDPGTRYEAEDAQLINGFVAYSDSASAGAYVTGLSPLGSSLTFPDVVVDESAEYCMRVGFANGRQSIARLSVYVNDEYRCTAFFYQTARAGSLSQNLVHIPIELTSGANRIELRKDNVVFGAVEIDYIDICAWQ
jgi:hypothetical protein